MKTKQSKVTNLSETRVKNQDKRYLQASYQLEARIEETLSGDFGKRPLTEGTAVKLTAAIIAALGDLASAVTQTSQARARNDEDHERLPYLVGKIGEPSDHYRSLLEEILFNSKGAVALKFFEACEAADKAQQEARKARRKRRDKKEHETKLEKGDSFAGKMGL